jgi:hypothetical protein
MESPMTATAFILWVLVGTAPPYARGEFRSYDSCVAAARSEVESLRLIEHGDVELAMTAMTPTQAQSARRSCASASCLQKAPLEASP